MCFSSTALVHIGRQSPRCSFFEVMSLLLELKMCVLQWVNNKCIKWQIAASGLNAFSNRQKCHLKAFKFPPHSTPQSVSVLSLFGSFVTCREKVRKAIKCTSREAICTRPVIEKIFAKYAVDQIKSDQQAQRSLLLAQ